MRLENEHRLNYAEENITDSITYRDIKNFFRCDRGKILILKIAKSSSCLQSKNVHGFILIQRMYHRFSVVGGDEPMNMILKKKRK